MHPTGTAGLPRPWRNRAAWAWLLVPVLWIAVSLISSVNGGMMISSSGHAERMSWTQLVTGALYDYSWWMIIGPAVVFVVKRLEDARPGTRLRIFAHLALAVASVLTYAALRSHIHLPGDTMFLATGWKGVRSVLASSLAFYLAIAACTSAVLIYHRVQEREREAAALALHASRVETQLVEAQLGVLRAQLHPHFLFNALHAVSALVDWRPKEARRMLVQLSELLRSAVEFSEQREIPLARELEWIDRYIELQQVRMGERLAVDVRIAPEVLGAFVPPLVLQPLVENAIRHGIERRTEGGHVEISAEREGKWLRLRVSDDGPGLGSAPSKSTGIGLRNTRERLRAVYGDEQQVALRERQGGGMDALVMLPFVELPASRSDARAG
jgi:two-component system, LytTR family, sensor kinase